MLLSKKNMQGTIADPVLKMRLRGLRYFFDSIAALATGTMLSDLLTANNGTVPVKMMLWKAGIVAGCSVLKFAVEAFGLTRGVSLNELKNDDDAPAE